MLSEYQFFFFKKIKEMNVCVQNCQSEKIYLPRMLHVLRLIHSDSKFDFEVLIWAVFRDCHFVPFWLFGAVWGGMENNLLGKRITILARNTIMSMFLSMSNFAAESWMPCPGPTAREKAVTWSTVLTIGLKSKVLSTSHDRLLPSGLVWGQKWCCLALFLSLPS